MPRTLADDLQSDVDNVFLQPDHFAETVTRYPLGVAENAVAVTADFQEQEPVRDTQRGEDNVRRGRLSISSDVDAHPNDTWLINSLHWDTLTVGPNQHGMQTVEVQRTEALRTRRGIRP